MIRPSTLAAAGLAVAATGLGSLAVPAAAAPTSETPGHAGRVVARHRLTTREAPSLSAPADGSLHRGDVWNLACKVRSSPVDGNALWYRSLTVSGSSFWSSARYMANIDGPPPYCGSSRFTGRTTTWANSRVAPDPTSAGAGPLRAGTPITLRCKIIGPSVGGNPRWYFTSDHRWLSARYVANVGHAPSFC